MKIITNSFITFESVAVGWTPNQLMPCKLANNYILNIVRKKRKLG